MQQKNGSRFIAERIICDIISHLMAVAVTNYQIRNPNPRLKSIKDASYGAINLYEIIKKENNDSNLLSCAANVYIKNQ